MCRFVRCSVLLTVLVCALRMSAQTSTGSVYGKVTDPKGLAVAGASVTVKSTDLATARVTRTDGSGAFSMAGLVPGAYTVEADKKPLRSRRPTRLTISVGSSTQLAIRLEIATVRQGTTVTGRAGGTAEGNTLAPPINTTEASVSSFLAGQTVTYLPLRDRDISQFDPLASNTHEENDDAGVSVDGQRGDALITQLDDVSLNSPLLGGMRGADQHGFLVPQTAVREMEIVSSGLGAEVGDTSAGLINLATKAGTNKFRGEQFYTVRPATLSSADAFGHSLDNFQSVFGGSFGGPLRKDRIFFYSGYEQNFLHLPTYFAYAPQAPNPTVAVMNFQGPAQAEIDERDTPIAFSTRYDQVVNAHNTVNLEIVANRVRVKNQGDGLSRTLAAPTFAASAGGQSFFTRAGLTTVLGPRTVNQAVFSWSQDHRQQTPNSTAPELFINGFGILGGDGLGPHRYTSQGYQMLDSVSVARGKNLFVFGGNFDVDPAYEQREANVNGRFDYDSLTSYQTNSPRRFQQTFVTGNTRYSGDVLEGGLYATAHVELRDGLTLTAGLLWSGQWNPQPAHPNAAIAQARSVPNDLAGWQPRAGVAWTPRKKMTVRASGGMYRAMTPATFFHRTFADNGTQTIVADSYFDPQILAMTGALRGSPAALATPPPGLTTPEAYVAGVDAGFRDPKSVQGSLTVDQTVSAKLTMRAGYLHEETWRLEQRLDGNLNAPTISAAGLPVFPVVRPISGVGRLMVEHSSAHSSYSGLTVTAIGQVSRRSSFTLNYTLAQTHDDGTDSGPYGIDSALDPFNLRLERGYSALDLRNTLNASAIFNLPFGLKFNPLLTTHSGAPYTALAGIDGQNDGNDFNDRAVVNGSVSGRNAFRQPAFVDTDLRMVKDFTLKGEGHHLDLFMDVFNVFGAANENFGAEQISLYGNASFPVYSAGQPLYAPGSSMPGGPRTFQFTARLVGF